MTHILGDVLAIAVGIFIGFESKTNREKFIMFGIFIAGMVVQLMINR